MMFSLHQRENLRERLGRGVHDLVIIGGGINGVAIARDAALRGYSVALVESNDFAWGTSSRSSRLIHGGLRYLEHGELGLVIESVSERARLARLARHLVRPLPFIVPVYRSDDWPLALIDLGLWIYDALALFRNYRTHRRLSVEALRSHVPGLEAEELTGGVLYYDYQTNDARLVLENALAAAQAGAVLLSYCRAERFEYSRRRARAIVARDMLTGRSLRIEGRAFVCAAGPWTDDVLAGTPHREGWLRPTKGVHIVVTRERLAVDRALVMRHPEDDRALFVLPHHERTVIGTTDTDFRGDPSDAETTLADVRYLIDATNRFFPAAGLEPGDVISNWCGVRPLLEADETDSPSAISRDHRVVVRDDGIVVIAGGKLTTHRRMAAECVDEAAIAIGLAGGPGQQRHCSTHVRPLPGAAGLSSEGDLVALANRLAHVFDGGAHCASHLASIYGTRASGLVDLARQDARLRAPIIADLPFVWAEIVFAARHEMALTLEDALIRRLDLFSRAPDQGLAILEDAATLMGRTLGWSVGERRRQIDAYHARVERSRAWKNRD